MRGREGGATAELSDDAPALRASSGGGSKAHVLTEPRAVAFRTSSLDAPRDDGLAPPLGCHANAEGYGGADTMAFVPAEPHAFNWQEDDSAPADRDYAPALKGSPKAGGANAVYEDVAGTVRSHMRPGSNHSDEVVAEGPADSPVPYDPRPDGPRYAAMGDAVTVNVIEWIGVRLRAMMRSDA